MARTDKRKPIPPHGTRARYMHHREPCKCDDCREANRDYLHQVYLYRSRNTVKRRYNKGPEHGSIEKYELGCRCWLCVQVELTG